MTVILKSSSKLKRTPHLVVLGLYKHFRYRTRSRIINAGVLIAILFLCLLVFYPDMNTVDLEPPDFVATLQIPELVNFERERNLELPFLAASKYAVGTLVLSDDYAVATLVLGYSLRKYNPDIDLVVGYSADSVSKETLCILEAGGWRPRRVSKIAPPMTPHNKPPWYFHDMFTKLRIWTWTEYEKLLYVDSDTLCLGSISSIFEHNITFAASLDVFTKALDSRMNMGVMLLKPDVRMFKQLLYDSHRYKYHYSREFAEQSFLYYETHSDVYNLPYMYNTNLAFAYHRRVWNDLVASAKLVHFTYPKPFRQKRNKLSNDPGIELIVLWYEYYDEFVRLHGKTVAKCGYHGLKLTIL